MPAHRPAPLPPSLYTDTARPAPATPPLDGDRKAAVCIIGGGFTGLSTALHLAEQGADAVVLEAHEPGWGASGRNGGQVNPGLKWEPDTIEADFGADLGGRMVRLAWGAPDLVFGLIGRHQITCEAAQNGTLRAAYQPADEAAIRAAFAQGARRDMPVEHLDATAIAARTGTTRYRAGLLDRRGGHVNPLGYARGLAQAAQQAGAAVHGGTKATRIWRDGAAWKVQTPTGTVTADRLVLATNGYTDDLWPQLRRSVVPVYSGIVASEPIQDEIAASVLPQRVALYELGRVTTYYGSIPPTAF